MGSSVSSSAPHRITLITRAGCHLCESAREEVQEVALANGVGWREIDVDADPDLARRHGEEVPVVLVDGRVHSWWTVDRVRLEQALQPGGTGPLRWLRNRG